MIEFLSKPAAAIPSAGGIVLLYVVFSVGCDSTVGPGVSDVYLFVGAIGIVAALLLFAGGLK